jgi:hypothetical protein
MPLEHEFLKHLHSLMAEVSHEVAEPEAKYKAQRLWEARRTGNGAAIPIAYKDCALHALQTRVGKTIEKYIEALSISGIEIDAMVEKEMINQFTMLTAGSTILQFPPALKTANFQAVQGAYARERQQVANQLVRQGTNRLRELKMKMKTNRRQSATPTINNIFNAPVGRAYINSTDQSVNTFAITEPILRDIDQISDGNPELQAVAQEIRNSSPHGPNLFDRVLKWVNLINACEGLSERVYQHYPQIVALLSKLTHGS